MIFLCSRACSEFISVLVRTCLMVADIPQMDGASRSTIFYAVLLIIQSSSTLTVSSPNATPPAVKWYFHRWEDYIIFALFIFFR
jgi:hypothetical protein